MLEQDRIIKINIEEEMKSSYIDYSMSVIVSRALILYICVQRQLTQGMTVGGLKG